MENNTQIVNFDEWVLRERKPSGNGPHPVILMLHGWTGDEDAMWVFISRLPKDHIFISPRGLYKTPWGGYGWQENTTQAWPKVEDLKPAISSLLKLLTVDNFPEANLDKLRVVGFSQGAALGYTFALLNPGRISAVAGLSGFLPEGIIPIIREHPLRGIPVFVTHGTKDELVPIERARNSVDLLEESGAEVTYCEDDVGHKLSSECFQGLEKFFTNL